MSRIPKIQAGIRTLRAELGPSRLPAVSAEITDEGVTLYTRVGLRPIPIVGGIMVTLADLTVTARRQGIMREIFEFAEAFVEADPGLVGVYVETVTNVEAVVPFLRERGYVMRDGCGFPDTGMGDWYRLKASGRFEA